MVTVIAVLAIGLVGLIVLATVVGIVDATQAGTWRGIKRGAEQGGRSRRAERLGAGRDRFPGI